MATSKGEHVDSIEKEIGETHNVGDKLILELLSVHLNIDTYAPNANPECNDIIQCVSICFVSCG